MRRGAAAVRLGVISDTHGLLRPEAESALRGAAHIIHAGDVGRPEILASLEAIAPTTAVRGNVDREASLRALPADATVSFAGRRIHVLHDIAELTLARSAADCDAIIFGHSHRPKAETREGVLYLNPGSAGPRRFKLPVTLATLDLADAPLTPQFHVLVD